MSADIETKLAAARTRLILDKPFLGALVMRLPMIMADPRWCKTTATDARAFYYNAAYIDSLSLEQTQFILSHEALHCALSHFYRRQHRLKNRWDVACDFAINPLLLDEGLTAPPNALYMEQFVGMTAEEIYPSLDDMEDKEPMDQHLYDTSDDDESTRQQHGESDGGKGGTDSQDDEHQGESGDHNPEQMEQEKGGLQGGDHQQDSNNEGQSGGAPQPQPLTDVEKQSLAVQWQQRMAGAAQQAMHAGKMGAALARIVDHMLQPQLPWRMLLARYMTARARDDYSFQRPSRREGNAILPSIHSRQVELVVVVDTSGSISDGEIQEFISEVDAIKGQMRARITLLACDDKLNANAPWVFEPWEAFQAPRNMKGGGGTSFIPPFEWLNKQQQPDLLVYFTDAEGAFPENEPAYPVIWLVKGKEQVPWGQRIQLN
jgi:predicted metal-dependent peptidase